MNFGLVAVFLLSAILANGQARVRPQFNENTSVKIYKTLDDMLSNKVDQTIEADYAVHPKEHGVTYHRVHIDKQKRKELGRVYGFKIGDEVFINPKRPKLKSYMDFYKTEVIGDYVNFARVGSIWVPNPANYGVPPYRFTYPREELVNTKTGKTKLLTRARLKKILKQDNNLALWKEFKQEKRKSMQLIPYLKQHEASTASN